MSITLIDHAASVGAGTSTAPSVTMDNTGANLLVAALAAISTAGPTDSSGNTWTLVFSSAVDSGELSLFYCANPVVSSSQTIAFAADYSSCCVASFAGVAAAPLDQKLIGTQATGVTTVRPGSIVPSQNNCLVISAVGSHNVASSVSVDSGLTLLDYEDFVTSSAYGSALAFYIQPVAASIDPTWTYNASVDAVAAILSFLSSGVGPVGGNASWTSPSPVSKTTHDW